jgi:hypothetical protein
METGHLRLFLLSTSLLNQRLKEYQFDLSVAVIVDIVIVMRN